jgi:hypothetical protein
MFGTRGREHNERISPEEMMVLLHKNIIAKRHLSI